MDAGCGRTCMSSPAGDCMLFPKVYSCLHATVISHPEPGSNPACRWLWRCARFIAGQPSQPLLVTAAHRMHKAQLLLQVLCCMSLGESLHTMPPGTMATQSRGQQAHPLWLALLAPCFGFPQVKRSHALPHAPPCAHRTAAFLPSMRAAPVPSP